MLQKRYGKIILFISILGVLLLWGTIVLAQVNVGLEEVGAEIGLGSEDIRIIIARIIRIFLGLLGIIIIGLIVYGGFVWMTAGGDPKKVAQARKIITNAVIGLIIVLASFALSHFILTSLIEATTKPGVGVSIPPGGPGGGFGSNVFVVRSISPAGSVRIRNVTARVVFNQAPDSTLVQDNIIITKAGARIEGTYITNGSVVEFTPLAACPEPNQDRKCFDADSDFHVAVSNNLKSRTGLSLTCGGFAPSCEGDFHTGNLVDIAGPTVVIRNPAQNALLAQDSSVNLEAEAVDDGGISYVEFYVDDSLVDIGAPSGGQTPLNFVASGIWNTTDVTVGSHEIKAKAYDIDANSSVSASVFVNLRPAHCFNGIQDGDETGVDCGEDDCGTCTNGGCQRDSDCASGSCVNGICLELPLISGLDPKDGKQGNLVTIFGSYFGATPGHVMFLGNEDPMDDKIALLGDCASAWQANQIVVKVPEGAVSGPLKVITSAELEDATNDQRGPLISDFIINNIIRPGICEVNPNSGVRGDVFVISGVQFGESQGTSRAVMADRDVSPQIWSNSSITGIVPAVVAGAYPVRVVANGQFSNAVNFRVSGEETGLKSTISYIDPTSAAKEDYVTIYGSNFGVTAGLVIFKNKATGDEAYGDTSFPAACGTNFWKNTSITVKVPKVYTDNRTETALGNYALRIKRQDSAESLPVDFQIVSGAPKPGLCAIIPDNGPAGRTQLKLVGERFGINQEQVKFYREINASVSSWNDNEIKAVVPVDASTGPVKVLVGASESNSVNFTVADCNASGCGTGEQCCVSGVCIPDTDQCVTGPRQGGYLWRFSTGVIPLVPQVVEECANGVSPSPSPWDARRGGNNVCVNAALGARFTTDVDEGTIDSTSIGVYKCVGPTVDEKGKSLNPCLEVERVDGRFNTTSNSFTFIPASDFATSTRYRVNLSRLIRGAGEGGGYMEVNEECGRDQGLYPYEPQGTEISYCFEFKTRAEAQNCELGSVVVLPADKTSDRKDEVIDYSASAISKDDICILLNGDAYNWDWKVLEDTGIASLRATVTNDDNAGGGASGTERNGYIDPAQKVTALVETVPEHPVRVTASVPLENRSDFGELIIDFTDPRITEYWPNCDTACVNAEIGFKTNVLLSESSLSENFHLYKCRNESCREFTEELVITSSLDTAAKTVVITNPPLTAADYYRVIIDGEGDGIKSTSGAEMAGANYGSNYSWTFRTRDSFESCVIESVSISPKDVTLRYIGEKASLGVSAVGAPDECNPNGQRLVATDYNWVWSVGDSAIADFYKLNNSPLNVLPRQGRINCAQNCLNTGTQGRVSVCGNNLIERGEDCDDGNINKDDGCSEKCLNEGSIKGGSTCGNGGPPEKGEDCEDVDKNIIDGDGCSHLCLNEGSTLGGSICGNGDLGDGEDCDDGNSASSDGCSAECLNEGSRTGPYPVCGNGTIEEGEDCDDRNLLNGDGCSDKCLKEGLNPCVNSTDLNCCGNGAVETGEDCDDRNSVSGDSCSNYCLNEGSNIKYDSICGDGNVTLGEECEFSPPDANIDPLQYIIAKKGGETKANVETRGKSDPDGAKITVECVCENDSMCAVPRFIDRLGCGNDKCCYIAPRIESYYPTGENVCRNAAIYAIFNKEMDQNSFIGNVSVYEERGGNWVEATTSTISGRNFSTIEDGIEKKTKVSLNLSAPLKANQKYRIEFRVGIKSEDGVAMRRIGAWEFTTINDVCVLDEVRLDPSGMYIFDLDAHSIEAVGYTKKENTLEEIGPIPNVYAWDWLWMIAATNTVDFAGGAPSKTGEKENAQQNLQVPTNVRQGETSLTVVASSTADIIYRRTFTKTASAPISILICENPWPTRTRLPFVDQDYGFEFFYCRDRGLEHNISDDLPTINVVQVPTPPTPNILREYLLTVNCSENNPNCRKGDAIGIRVNPNPEHFSPEKWYEKQGFGGAPKETTVDGFEAVQEGRTVYISAPYQYNYKNREYTLYSNIYILSYNENVSPHTLEVYEQVLSSLKFLANLDKTTRDRRFCKIFPNRDWLVNGKLLRCSKRSDCQNFCPEGNAFCRRTVYCDAKKTLLRREMKSIAQIRDMEETFYRFGSRDASCSVTASLSCMSDADCLSGETCVKKYPNLAAGTFIPYYTNSKWPSWQSALGNTLGSALPEEPLNEFSSACPREYNFLTCFNAASSTFYCPARSHFYEYKSEPDGKKFTLGFNLEYTELFSLRAPAVAERWAPDGSWHYPIPRLYSDGNYTLNAHKYCEDNVISSQSGRCGDGIVGKDILGNSETCEIGQTRVESCGINQFRQDSCANDCLSWTSGTCSTTRCGDGIVQGGEVCDDGALNGRYGKCSTTCEGIGPYCGDGAPQLDFEECDLGSQNGIYASGCSSECKSDGPKCGDNILQGGLEECDTTISQTLAEGCAIQGQVKSKICEKSGTRRECETVTVRHQEELKVCYNRNSSDARSNTNCPDCSGVSLQKSCENPVCCSKLLSPGVEPSCMSRKKNIWYYDCYITTTTECRDVPFYCQWGDWGACAYPGACGNGVKEGIEQCDDGNKSNTDGCLNNCVLPRCGDGFVRQGYEMCDMGSGNKSPQDLSPCIAPYGGQCVYCSNNCQLVTRTGPYCGDNRRNAPYEFCDGSDRGDCSRIGWPCRYDCSGCY